MGHAVLPVLHTLTFDFLNFRSGRLDRSYAAIARAATVCERTFANALKRLKALGSAAGCTVAPRCGRTGVSCSNRRRTLVRALRPPPSSSGNSHKPCGTVDLAERISVQ